MTLPQYQEDWIKENTSAIGCGIDSFIDAEDVRRLLKKLNKEKEVLAKAVFDLTLQFQRGKEEVLERVNYHYNIILDNYVLYGTKKIPSERVERSFLDIKKLIKSQLHTQGVNTIESQQTKTTCSTQDDKIVDTQEKVSNAVFSQNTSDEKSPVQIQTGCGKWGAFKLHRCGDMIYYETSDHYEQWLCDECKSKHETKKSSEETQ